VTRGARQDARMPPETFDAPSAPEPVGPYSHAAAGGGLVYLSGQTPIDPGTGRLVEGGVDVQARRFRRAPRWR
jgi:2-iminobutanoate/2-iminopropanoate deaminase